MKDNIFGDYEKGHRRELHMEDHSKVQWNGKYQERLSCLSCNKNAPTFPVERGRFSQEESEIRKLDTNYDAYFLKMDEFYHVGKAFQKTIGQLISDHHDLLKDILSTDKLKPEIKDIMIKSSISEMSDEWNKEVKSAFEIYQNNLNYDLNLTNWSAPFFIDNECLEKIVDSGIDTFTVTKDKGKIIYYSTKLPWNSIEGILRNSIADVKEITKDKIKYLPLIGAFDFDNIDLSQTYYPMEFKHFSQFKKKD